MNIINNKDEELVASIQKIDGPPYDLLYRALNYIDEDQEIKADKNQGINDTTLLKKALPNAIITVNSHENFSNKKLKEILFQNMKHVYLKPVKKSL